MQLRTLNALLRRLESLEREIEERNRREILIFFGLALCLGYEIFHLAGMFVRL
jgi:hypothetical protein